jgi:hypothetical protein
MLQARTALVTPRAIARSLRTSSPELAADVERRLEQLESGTVQFALVRAAHLVATGSAALPAELRAELDRLVDGGDPASLVDLPSNTEPSAVRDALVAAIGRWRSLSSDPLADPATVEVADVAARAFEHAIVTLPPG